jgi:hypothetical protein
MKAWHSQDLVSGCRPIYIASSFELLAVRRDQLAATLGIPLMGGVPFPCVWINKPLAYLCCLSCTPKSAELFGSATSIGSESVQEIEPVHRRGLTWKKLSGLRDWNDGDITVH